MSLNIEIIEEKENPLIDRTEILFTIDNFGKGTPNRLDIKKKISAMQGSDELLTILKKIDTHFGSASVKGKVYIYKDPKDVAFFEPFHIRTRNLPLEKRAEVYKLKKKGVPYQHLL